MAYQVFLSYLPLPIAPAAITTVYGNRNKTIELIDGTEGNILKQPGLTEISFEFLIPHTNYPFASAAGSVVGGITEALGDLGNLASGVAATLFLDELERWKKDKEPFQFICVRMIGEQLSLTNFNSFSNINLKMVLEDYSVVEDRSQYGFDLCVKVRLKTYNPPRTAEVNQDGTTKEQRA